MHPVRSARLELGFGDVYISFVKKLCTDCFHIGQERSKTPFIFIVDVVFAVIIALCLIYTEWLGLIFYGIIFIVYLSIMRLWRKEVCPRCGHSAMIPVETPKAQVLIEQNNLSIDDIPAPKEQIDLTQVSLLVAVLVLLGIALWIVF